jgi:hypothetical protein
MSQKRERMKGALVTIVIANRGGMGVFSQQALPIESQVSRGTSVDSPLAHHTVLMRVTVEDRAGEYARPKGMPIEWG